MITRFAPSPTGPLHLGHAYSALLAHDMARQAGGTFILRIEDIDQNRSRPQWEHQIYDDLAWLGLRWETPVMRQSERSGSYRAALDHLQAAGLLYPCTCTRKDIAVATTAPQEGYAGFDGAPYPGICRHKTEWPDSDFALRLNMKKATQNIESVSYLESDGKGFRTISTSAFDLVNRDGDIVVARKDIATSYHLSVVVDDAAQGITDVIRGEDLKPATPVQALLQRLLGLPTPRYHHHRLIRDDSGKRLAKRDDARAIRTYRSDGATPQDIRRMVGLPQNQAITKTTL